MRARVVDAGWCDAPGCDGRCAARPSRMAGARRSWTRRRPWTLGSHSERTQFSQQGQPRLAGLLRVELGRRRAARSPPRRRSRSPCVGPGDLRAPPPRTGPVGVGRSSPARHRSARSRSARPRRRRTGADPGGGATVDQPMCGTTSACSRATVPGHSASPGSGDCARLLGPVEHHLHAHADAQHRAAAGEPGVDDAAGPSAGAQPGHAGVEVAHPGHEQPVGGQRGLRGRRSARRRRRRARGPARPSGCCRCRSRARRLDAVMVTPPPVSARWRASSASAASKRATPRPRARRLAAGGVARRTVSSCAPGQARAPTSGPTSRPRASPPGSRSERRQLAGRPARPGGGPPPTRSAGRSRASSGGRHDAAAAAPTPATAGRRASPSRCTVTTARPSTRRTRSAARSRRATGRAASTSGASS